MSSTRGCRTFKLGVGALFGILSLLAVVAGPPVVGDDVAGNSARSGKSVTTRPVSLGSAADFTVLAGSAIINAGTTTVDGDVGLSPGTSLTGFGPGKVHAADAVAAKAENDLLAAYDDVAKRPTTDTLPPTLDGPRKPGIYDSATGSFEIAGTLTLDAAGNPDAVFIFKVTSRLVTASASHVRLINGARAANVLWQVGDSVLLGAHSVLQGDVLALASITVESGAVVRGRVLAHADSVTLDNATVGRPSAVSQTVGPSARPVGVGESVTFVVTSPVVGGIVNGGFETGTFSGWTTTGTASVVGAPVHSGAHAARVGSSSPTMGDSSVAQTFTVPSGVVGLSFWYDVFCSDRVAYDWAMVTLTDVTSGVTSTPLPKTCVNGSGWVNVVVPIVAGHRVTLTLINHDDNYPGDPTYTLFDDVTLTSPPPVSGIVNGGFETGTFSGWTTTGTASVVGAPVHSGAHAARVGSSSPTKGDSTVAQTFTISVGATGLSLWYDVFCPDRVAYDWAMAMLTDVTSGVTSTPLPKTCVNGSGWVNVVVPVVAGHRVTLTLVNHDDNYPGDPTYTLFDDIALR